MLTLDICRDCNSKFGAGADAHLAKQLNFYANILLMERESGQPQPVIMERLSDGKKFRIGPRGRPQIKDPVVIQKKSGNDVAITIEARDEREAKEILTGLARKYGNLNVEEFPAKAQHVQEQIEEPLHIGVTVGGKEAAPSVLKTAISYYIELTGDAYSVAGAIAELRAGETRSVEPIIMDQRIYQLDDEEVSHSVYVVGQKHQGLYGIVEYFNVIQFLIKLSDRYDGEDIESLYVFDVLKRTRLEKAISTRLRHDFVFGFQYSKSNPDFQIMQAAASRVMGIAMKRQQEARLSEIVAAAWKETIGKMIPEGAKITEDAANAFNRQLMIELEPYLRSLFVRKRVDK
jgi:hypothetical protein